MEKPNRFQRVLKLFLIAALLIISTLLSTTSHRSKYLYFIVNIVIIALGAEAGLLSFFNNNPSRNKKLPPPPQSELLPAISPAEHMGRTSPQSENGTTKNPDQISVDRLQKPIGNGSPPEAQKESPATDRRTFSIGGGGENSTATEGEEVVEVDEEDEKGLSENSAQVLQKVSPVSTDRSLFSIGGCENSIAREGEEVDDVDYGEEDEAGEGVGEMSGQELFQQSEDFIGNFHKQLKMQRQLSWKNLQDLIYDQKAF